MKSLILLLIISFFYSSKAQTTKITGTLEGVDGKLSLAHVHVQKDESSSPVNSYKVDKNGNFSFNINKKGVYYLQFTGVNHSPLKTPIFLNGGKEIKLKVKLSTYKINNVIDKVKIIGKFNNYNFSSGKLMKKEKDGTFSFTMKTDEPFFEYQLLGVDVSRSINGTQSDSYKYDGGGDYISVVKVKGGKVHITFDPGKLVRSDQEGSIEFVNKNSVNNQVFLLNKTFNLKNEDFRKKITEYRNRVGDLKGFSFDFGDFKTRLEKNIKDNPDKLIKKVSLIYYASLLNYRAKDIDTSLALKVFDEVSPASNLWSLNTMALFKPLSLYPNRNDFTQKLLSNKYLNNEVKANLLSQELFEAKFVKKDEDKTKTIYNRIQKEYGNTNIAKYLKSRFFTKKKVAPGKKVPEFSVKSIDDSNVVYSNKSLLGNVYLIDFWATWCGPCLGEMKFLHNAYAKFKDKGLKILSLSFDTAPEKVKNFRNKKWKMPWMHSFVKGGFSSKLAKKFEVLGIPKPILVDKDGKIIASEMDVRGSNLEKILNKVFGK